MSLKEVQNLLVRLYTDADLRERFLSEPSKIGRQNNLSEKEAEQIAQVLPDELRFFAESLFHKRLREVEKLLPLTHKVLGENFAFTFRQFSNQFTPISIKKHLEDAIEFSRFLQKFHLKPLWVADLIKFERVRLEVKNSEKQFAFCCYHHDIRQILKQISFQDAAAQNFKPRLTFALRLRISGKTRHFVW